MANQLSNNSQPTTTTPQSVNQPSGTISYPNNVASAFNNVSQPVQTLPVNPSPNPNRGTLPVTTPDKNLAQTGQYFSNYVNTNQAGRLPQTNQLNTVGGTFNTIGQQPTPAPTSNNLGVVYPQAGTSTANQIPTGVTSVGGYLNSTGQTQPTTQP